MIRLLFLLSLLLTFTEPCFAIRQGTATADLFIKRYTLSSDFGKLALWHEAAAECLKRISVPMNQIAYDYYVRHGYRKWARRAKKEAQEIQEQYQSHRAHAKIARQKFVREVCNQEFVGGVCTEEFVGGVCNPDSLWGQNFVGGVCTEEFVGGVCNPDSLWEQKFVGGVCNPDSLWGQKFVGGVCNPDSFPLDTESENIKKFITTWLPHYPNRFYDFGIYPTFFKRQRELAEQEQNYIKVLHLEADAAEMCAAQYEQIPIAYGLRNYEKHRDAYRQYAVRLRRLAQLNPKTLPPEVGKGRRISDSLTIQTISSQQKIDTILQITKSDVRVKSALTGQRGVNAYPTFQGFVWIVRFSNHSRGNIAVAIVDDKTARVLDVF